MISQLNAGNAKMSFLNMLKEAFILIVMAISRICRDNIALLEHVGDGKWSR